MSDTPEQPAKSELSIADKQYQDMLRAGLVRMSQAANEMNDYVAQRRRKVPEQFFVNVLLPIIRTHVTGGATEQLGVWLNTADGMHNRMDVIDEEGNVVCTIPPAFNTIPDRSTRPEPGSRTPTIAQLVERQGDMLDNGDTRGVMDIEGRIYEQCAPRPEDSEKTENLMLLIQMYERYELPLVEILGEAAEEFAELLRANPTGAVKGSKDDDVPEEDLPLIY